MMEKDFKTRVIKEAQKDHRRALGAENRPFNRKRGHSLAALIISVGQKSDSVQKQALGFQWAKNRRTNKG